MNFLIFFNLILVWGVLVIIEFFLIDFFKPIVGTIKELFFLFILNGLLFFDFEKCVIVLLKTKVKFSSV